MAKYTCIAARDAGKALVEVYAGMIDDVAHAMDEDDLMSGPAGFVGLVLLAGKHAKGYTQLALGMEPEQSE